VFEGSVRSSMVDDRASTDLERCFNLFMRICQWPIKERG
jgi:hypothetical protein